MRFAAKAKVGGGNICGSTAPGGATNVGKCRKCGLHLGHKSTNVGKCKMWEPAQAPAANVQMLPQLLMLFGAANVAQICSTFLY
jgi:hypothetical protein